MKTTITVVIPTEIPSIWWGVYSGTQPGVGRPYAMFDSRHGAVLWCEYANKQPGFGHYTICEVCINPERGFQ